MDNKIPTKRSHYSIIALMLFATFLILIIINFKQTLSLIKFFYNAIAPFILGFVIAYILNIIIKYYEKFLPKTKKSGYKKSISRFFSIISALITIVAFFGIVAFLAIPQLIKSLSILIQAVPSVYNVLLAKTHEYITLLPPNYQHILADNMEETLASFDIKAIGNILITKILQSLNGLLHLILNSILGFIFAIFILFNKEGLKRQAKKLGLAFLSTKNYKRCQYVLGISDETFSSFIMGQFLDATILGCMVTLGLLIFGVNYPFSIGCAVGLLSLIPLLGAYLGGLMGVIMLLPLGISQPIIFVIILTVIQQIESNLIYPKVVGGSIGLPGIWTFMAITLGGSLYGVLGMIISVPLAAILYKLLCNEVNGRLKEKKPFN